MHCALFGVVRKVVILWFTGCHQTGKKCNSRFRISNRQKYIINERLFILKKYIPREFLENLEISLNSISGKPQKSDYF